MIADIIIYILVFCVLVLPIIKIILSKSKYNINDYFYCSLNNHIYMRNNKKEWKKHTYYTNKRKMFDNFEKLPTNRIIKCLTHKHIIKKLNLYQKRGYISDLKIYPTIIIKNIGQLERKLGKKQDFSGYEKMFFAIFKVTKTS